MSEIQEVHTYHHYDNDGIRINTSFEKNSKGYNYSATVVGAKTVDEALNTLKEVQEKLEAHFDAPPAG